MKSIDEVIYKYKEIFGIEKDYLEILRECHKNIIEFKEKSFTLWDFKTHVDYKDNLYLINQFRKYAVLDDFLLGITDYSLMTVDSINNFKANVTYHDIMEAIDVYEETFDNMKSFYIRKDNNFENNELIKKSFLTINDIFTYQNESNFMLYFIESSETYYFSVLESGYEYIYELPFKEIYLSQEKTNSEIVLGYLYLITEYVTTNAKNSLKDKYYTTLTNAFGKSFEDFLKVTEEKGRYGVYNRSIKPFLIEYEELNYFIGSIDIPNSDNLDDYENERENKNKEYYKYFQNLDFDKDKVKEYVETNWIQSYDIGRSYKIDFNLVDTKEELDKYRKNIIEQKINDILLNLNMYKKHGLNKYNQDKKFLDDYSSFVKDYLSNFETVKKEFNTVNDKRLNLDETDLFAVGLIESSITKYSINKFEHSNNNLNDLKVFMKGKKSVQIQLNLEKFIEVYNNFKNDNILDMNYDWYFPYLQLKAYVENHIKAFCHIRLTSGVREEEFNVLKDILFLEGKDRKQILNHPDFIQDTGKYTVQSRNPYYFEIPAVLNMYMDVKEFDKIKKGTHPVFKSNEIENMKKDDDNKLLTSERFLSKKEIIEQNNYDVVYTYQTHKSLNNFRGIKGKIISVDKEIIIEDELGNIHTESFRSIGKSGWVHLSTADYNKIYSKLTLNEKSLLESNRKSLIEMDEDNKLRLN